MISNRFSSEFLDWNSIEFEGIHTVRQISSGVKKTKGSRDITNGHIPLPAKYTMHDRLHKYPYAQSTPPQSLNSLAHSHARIITPQPIMLP